MNIFSLRMSYFWGFVAILFFLYFAYYLETYVGVIPCPLCILQRIALAMLGIFFFFGAILNVKKLGQNIVALGSLLFSVAGLLFSGRQVWLQHLPPDNMADCGVSLNYLIRVMPPGEVIKKIFSGTAECAQKAWMFLNLSLAEWSLICFSVFTLFCLWQWVRILRSNGDSSI